MTTPPWARRLLASLDASDQRAIAVARTLSETQLNWRADQSSWSIGQCLDHLRESNELYGRAMDAALQHPRGHPVDEITPGWFGGLFIRTVIDPATAPTKRKAPAKIVPASTVDETILDRFLRSNDVTRRVIERAQSIDVNRVRFKNPFVWWIRFTVGTGLEIIVRHEDRHLLQAERIRSHANFPTGENQPGT
jgi:hypothetical protein